MQPFTFNTVRQIVNAPGSALALADHCRRLGVQRPLLVTDPGLMAIGLVPPVIAAIEEADLPLRSSTRCVKIRLKKR